MHSTRAGHAHNLGVGPRTRRPCQAADRTGHGVSRRRHTIERLTPGGTDEALLYRRFTGTAFLGAVTAGARVDFAGSGAFTAQRHVEDLLTLTGQPRPDHTGSCPCHRRRKAVAASRNVDTAAAAVTRFRRPTVMPG